MRRLGAGLLIAGLAAAAWLWPARPVLVVRQGAVPVLALPLLPGETVGVRFVHSVDHLPVEDRYVASRGRGLVQVETRLLSFGTGMGTIPGQGRAVVDGPWLRVTDMSRAIGRLVLRVGSPGVDHAVLYRGCAFSLTERWAGERLVLEAVWVGPWLHELLDLGGRLIWAIHCRR
ncbi:MAG: DUF1850 domain-containing protein [Bacillota bacterium]